MAPIHAWLAAHSILLAGRYAEWEYYNPEYAFLAGRRADTTRALQRPGGPHA